MFLHAAKECQEGNTLSGANVNPLQSYQHSMVGRKVSMFILAKGL